MSKPVPAIPRLSRRALVGSSLAGAALAAAGSGARAAALPVLDVATGAAQAAATPAGWRMWLLDAPDELRPAVPGAPTADEIEEVVKAQAERTDEMTAAITRWGAGPANLPWSALTPELFLEFAVNGMRQGRNLALLHTAVHDAAIAAWDA